MEKKFDNYVIVIGGGYSTSFLIKSLKADYRIILIDSSSNPYSKKYSDIFIKQDLNNIKLLISKINNFIKIYNLNLIVSFSANHLILSSMKILKINFPKLININYSKLELSLNKKKLYNYLKIKKILTPKLYSINELKSKKKSLNNKNFIIKPFLNTSGSANIKKINYHESIIQKTNEIIIQDYIDGNIYSVNTIIQSKELHLLCIVKKIIGKNFLIKEFEINQNKNIEKKLINYIHIISKKMNLKNNFYNFELILSKSNKIFLLEFGIFFDTKIDRFLEINNYPFYQNCKLLYQGKKIIKFTESLYLFKRMFFNFNKSYTFKSNYELEKTNMSNNKNPLSMNNIHGIQFKK